MLAQRLRQDVVESEILMQVRLAYMGSVASLHAHPGTDPDKGLKQVNDLHRAALSATRYLDVPTSSDGIDEGWKRTIDNFKALKQAKQL